MFRPVRSTTTDKHRERVLPVLFHCEEHLDQPLELAELAAIAGFAPHHFHRVFRQVTGETPKAYLRRLRLERAVYRLKVSPDNVLEIALDAGFTTHETFTRAFARQFGMTPSEFRAMLRAYRACAGDDLSGDTAAGFTEETPLTLRFDMRKVPFRVERAPGRHLLFLRHNGFQSLTAACDHPLQPWEAVFEYADAHGIAYAPDAVVGVSHDDPYVTEDHQIRFDACLVLDGPLKVGYPAGYRYQPPGLCVVRRHTGGVEEIARTFAYIGVEWLPPQDYGLRAAPPFEVHHCEVVEGRRRRTSTHAYVPLEPTKLQPTGAS